MFKIKSVAQNIIIISIVLVIGSLLGKYVFVLPLVIFSYYAFRGKYNSLILFIIMWTYIYNYYPGQGLIRNASAITFFLKPNLYVILAFIVFKDRIVLRTKFEKQIFRWSVFASLVVFTNNLYYSQLSWEPITYPIFIYTYILVANMESSSSANSKLINLLVAIGFVQVIMSVLQVSDIITRPVWIDPGGALYEIGLSDAACGTMGLSRSNVTSWISTILFTFYLAYSVKVRSLKIAFFSLIFFFQYATVDSKTALLITLAGIIYLVMKQHKEFKDNGKNSIVIISVIIGLFIVRSLLQSYYTNKLDVTFESRVDKISTAYSVVTETPEEWGKFLGYSYLSQAYIDSGYIQFFFGYGYNNFNYANMREYDIASYRIENSVKSWSTFIRYYGQFGVPGLLLIITLVVLIRKDIRLPVYHTVLGKSYSKSGIVIIDMSIVFMFLYAGHHIRDEAFLLLLLLHAYVKRHELLACESNFYRKRLVNGKI